ncbi:hypothetical protein BV25DRAFT_1922605 [Artomyces pyxidatus]|uniref:Uncharacterized protein n=1 Tax=Artomyces pyxidatus TaxID=48021 RepID=A0ACB8SE66_9AGAM|nr:hypothetical protein BV25DRAFT_1922605 [Artomyces pyxidatus]
MSSTVAPPSSTAPELPDMLPEERAKHFVASQLLEELAKLRAHAPAMTLLGNRGAAMKKRESWGREVARIVEYLDSVQESDTEAVREIVATASLVLEYANARRPDPGEWLQWGSRLMPNEWLRFERERDGQEAELKYVGTKSPGRRLTEMVRYRKMRRLRLLDDLMAGRRTALLVMLELEALDEQFPQDAPVPEGMLYLYGGDTDFGTDRSFEGEHVD